MTIVLPQIGTLALGLALLAAMGGGLWLAQWVPEQVSFALSMSIFLGPRIGKRFRSRVRRSVTALRPRRRRVPDWGGPGDRRL
jgi:hypothetical protein